MNNQTLPPLSLPPHGLVISDSSPCDSTLPSSVAAQFGSRSSFSTAPSSNGPATPSPSLPYHHITGPPTTIATYDAMNQNPHDMYYPPSMSAGQQPPPVTSSALSHYAQQQPTLLQSGPPYSSGNPYHFYTTPQALAPPTGTSSSVSNPMGSPQNVLPLPGVTGQAGGMQSPYPGFDTTGQQPPPGVKPRVTATLWEDEGSLCFQVEARGICVARRQDNAMINGTKLLNVAGMTRGRRDGILKSEKIRHVVKIGPMHLKGVWIPYERALDFANKEKITEMLYPLFVQNISSLLYHPTNQHRSTQVMAAAERRKQEQGQIQTSPGTLPSIQQSPHQHGRTMGLPPSQPTLPSHSSFRPPIERAHTFPTPPSGGSGVMSSMGGSENYSWQGQGMNGSQGTNPINVDAGLHSGRSMPNTPATTPPGPPLHSMQSYSSVSQTYDAPRPMYHAHPSHSSPYPTSANATPHDRQYGQPNPYARSHMAPPTGRPSLSGPPGEPHEAKPVNGVEDDADHEHEAEYTHDSGAYETGHRSYNYSAPGVSSLASDTHVSPELTGSPNHAPGSGRATPRTAAPPQPYYPQQTGYNTPPRVQPSSIHLFNAMTIDRTPANGSNGNEVYAPPADMSSSMPNGYAPQPPLLNGSAGSMKRGRDDEDDMPRADNDGGMGAIDLKRRKTMLETSIPAPTYDAMNRPTSAISAPRR